MSEGINFNTALFTNTVTWKNTGGNAINIIVSELVNTDLDWTWPTNGAAGFLQNDGNGTLTWSGTSGVGVTNLGTGEGVFFQNVGSVLQFKSLIGGTGIDLTSDNDEITINIGTHASLHEIGGADIIDLTSLSGYSANEHIDHTAVSILAGTGISGTGLGNLTTSRTINMANTAVTPGSYGSMTQVGTFTVDQQGRLTAAANVTLAPDHNTLTNYDANEHVDHTTVSISAGTGISSTGLGDLTATRTINIANTAVTPSSYGSSSQVSTFTVDQQGRLTAASNTSINHDILTNFVANEHVDHTAVSISAGTGISSTGLGDLTATRTINIANTAVTPASYGSSSQSGTFTVDQQGRLTAASATNIDHDALTNFAANEHVDHTGVSISAGTGISSTGLGDLTATRTINIANTAVTPASYGSVTQVGTFTVDQQGRLTAAANVTLAPDHNALTNYDANEHVDHTGVSISAGTGISSTGLGDLTATRTINIANTAVTPASYGSSSQSGTFTVDQQGRLTAASATNIDHDALTNFVANEHIDWTNASSNLLTSGTANIDTNSATAFRVRNSAGSVTSLLINTTTPRVDIPVALQYTGSTPTNGHILTTDASGNATWQAVPSGSLTSQTIEVHNSYTNSGNFRNSIAAAITHAITLTPTANNPILIDVLPGYYGETVSLAPPAYVHIHGRDKNTCYVQLTVALGVGVGFFDITTSNSSITGITIDAGANADYAFHCNGSDLVSWIDLVIFGGTSAVVQLDSTGTVNFFLQCVIFISQVSSAIACFDVSNTAQMGSIGNAVFDSANFRTNYGYKFTGSPVPASGFRNQPSNSSLQNFDICVLLDGSTFFNTGGDFYNSTTGVKLINSSKATLTAMSINCTDNINMDATSSIFTNGVLFNDVSNLTLGNTTNVSIDYFEEEQDNQLGRHILGNFTTGSKNVSSNSFMGQGSYQYAGINFFKTDDDITYTDTTNNLRPSAASTTTIFDDLTNGVFYIGDDVKFYSLEYDVATVLSGIIILEYWNGSAWTSLNNMTTQASRPYGSYENLIFTAVEEQDSRFDVRLTGATFNWSLSTINGSNKYWVRLRPSGTLTTSPVLNFLRVLYNSTKIDNEGILLKYGNARPYKNIIYDINLIQSAGTPPSDQDIWFGEDSSLGRVRNELNTGDKFGFTFFAPNDLDSSSPFRIYLAYISTTTAATQADFVLQITVGNAHIGDQVYQSQASANGNTIRDQQQFPVSMPVNQTDGTLMHMSEFFAPIPFIKSREIDGTLSELFHVEVIRTDTETANLVLIQLTILYLSFADGLSFI